MHGTVYRSRSESIPQTDDPDSILYYGISICWEDNCKNKFQIFRQQIVFFVQEQSRLKF
jgi:hypothetical protein